MALLQLDGPELARRVGDAVPDSVVPAFDSPLSESGFSGLKDFQDSSQGALWVKTSCYRRRCRFLAAG